MKRFLVKHSVIIQGNITNRFNDSRVEVIADYDNTRDIIIKPRDVIEIIDTQTGLTMCTSEFFDLRMSENEQDLQAWLLSAKGHLCKTMHGYSLPSEEVLAWRKRDKTTITCIRSRYIVS